MLLFIVSELTFRAYQYPIKFELERKGRFILECRWEFQIMPNTIQAILINIE